MATGGPYANGNSKGVRIVVAGDRGTGKSSLIFAAASAAGNSFPNKVPTVLPPTRLRDDMYAEKVPVTIIDTSASIAYRRRLAEEFQRADAVVLTYACDRPATLDRLSNFWLPELRRLEVKVPIVVAGCKLDLRFKQQTANMEQVITPLMQQYREIETCTVCSALNNFQIPQVFYYAQKAVIHPTAPLFDMEARTLKPQCIKALERIFTICDQDRDGALSDSELNDCQVKCFNAPLQPRQIVDVKRVVQEKVPGGVNDRGLTLAGFLFLHELSIQKGSIETTWTVLRKFGYDNNIRLDEDDQLPPPILKAADQVPSPVAIDDLCLVEHTSSCPAPSVVSGAPFLEQLSDAQPLAIDFTTAVEGGRLQTVAPCAPSGLPCDLEADTKVHWQGRFFVSSRDVPALDAYVERFPTSLVDFNCPSEDAHKPLLHSLARHYSRFYRDRIVDFTNLDLDDFEKTLRALKNFGADVSQIFSRVQKANYMRTIVEMLATHRAQLGEMMSEKARHLARLAEVRAQLASYEQDLESLCSRIEDLEREDADLMSRISKFSPHVMDIDPTLPLGHGI